MDSDTRVDTAHIFVYCNNVIAYSGPSPRGNECPHPHSHGMDIFAAARHSTQGKYHVTKANPYEANLMSIQKKERGERQCQSIASDVLLLHCFGSDPETAKNPCSKSPCPPLAPTSLESWNAKPSRQAVRARAKQEGQE